MIALICLVHDPSIDNTATLYGQIGEVVLARIPSDPGFKTWSGIVDSVCVPWTDSLCLLAGTLGLSSFL